ncbi:MAG TPA: helix-turn-helix transcriptional regulator [Terriglobia bacterium]|nr:helix-turn-helix transcriptional regulator [Terriglobia bacterium]
MGVGARLRQLRQEKNLSQGDITETTGLARSYISRVEHGHTVPSVETLHRFAAALGVPLYKIFYRSEEALVRLRGPERSLEHLASEEGTGAEEARFLMKMKEFSAKMDESERALLLQFARKLAHNRPRHREPRDPAGSRHGSVGAGQIS